MCLKKEQVQKLLLLNVTSARTYSMLDLLHFNVISFHSNPPTHQISYLTYMERNIN